MTSGAIWLCWSASYTSAKALLLLLLSIRSQHVMVDGCRSKLVNVVSGVPQGSILVPLRCTRSGVNRSTHFVALYVCLMFQSGLNAVLWSHIGILLRLPAAEPRSITGLLLLSLSLSGMIWLTPYLMVWDWRVSRAGPMLFCGPSCSLIFCLQLFSLSLLVLYRLVVWGWGLRTDRVSISLSRPCIANLF